MGRKIDFVSVKAVSTYGAKVSDRKLVKGTNRLSMNCPLAH